MKIACIQCQNNREYLYIAPSSSILMGARAKVREPQGFNYERPQSRKLFVIRGSCRYTSGAPLHPRGHWSIHFPRSWCIYSTAPILDSRPVINGIYYIQKDFFLYLVKQVFVLKCSSCGCW